MCATLYGWHSPTCSMKHGLYSLQNPCPLSCLVPTPCTAHMIYNAQSIYSTRYRLACTVNMSTGPKADLFS